MEVHLSDGHIMHMKKGTENISPVDAHEEVRPIHNMTAENNFTFQVKGSSFFLILTVDKELLASFTNASECSFVFNILQPEHGRDFVTVVKQHSERKLTQSHITSCVSSSVKQFQNEVNDICSERLARRQLRNHKTMTVAGAREIVGIVRYSALGVVQPNGIQCFNCKGDGHYARECRKPKRLSKLMARGPDEEIDEQEIGSTLQLQAMIQEGLHEAIQFMVSHWNRKDDINVIPDSSNICTNDNQVDQNAAACVDERVALANLIASLTLDMEENKTVLKQLKKAIATSLTQELKE
ncbi:gag-pol polyprotein [Tanacetum coccineum]